MAQSADAVKSETVTVTFEPELVARFWQHSAMRMMRANERILHGLMNAATREMELAQELMRYNMAKLKKFSNGGGPEKIPAQEAQNVQAFEHIVAGLREVSQDLWKTFGDASKLLLEGSLTEAEDVFAEPVKQAVKHAESVAEHFSESIKE